MSDDGASSIVVIALVGNVFSPRWARARRRNANAASLDFSAINVSLRSGGQTCWVLTEYGRSRVARTAADLAIGSSSMAWEGDDLVVRVDEVTTPWGSRVRGTIRLVPLAESETVVDLDPHGHHTWSPRVPMARVEVDFDEPRVSFRGMGYFDVNRGLEPLEERFSSWSWSRVSSEKRVAIAYEVALSDGRRGLRAFRGEPGGALQPVEAGESAALGKTRFGLLRVARCEAEPVEVVRTLEDGPFYARSLVRTRLDGERAFGMHETVSLDRFRAAWVRFLVPFRMRVEAAA